ncbi:unnamed protein product [Adineta steineri]|uniref:G-protein coupled receptors family 1 profile domain-containing protein n=2 Tax=Adineta steineri TaxID=433720 RepID=A0A814NIM0_9BILA|nr:unnamed protein product [Adineta steineri]CAF3845545.1 unnamed protein product [Adineta steineri]
MASTLLSSQILEFASEYSVYSNCILSIIGLLSNILNVLVFIRLKQFRDNRCVFYFLVESISNSINEVFTLIVTFVSVIYGNNATNFSLFWCKARYILFQSTGLVTFSMICFAACDQFCSTNYRINLREICTIKLAQCLVFTFILIWCLHSILFSFFLDINPLLGCIVINPIWIRYVTYFFYPVVSGFFPIVFASLFSLLAYENVRRVIRRQIPLERRQFDQQITAMVLIRVMLYVILSLPYTIYRVYSININTQQIDLLRSAIERLIQTIFYSISGVTIAVNFYLFLISSSRYRRQVKYVLKKKYWRPMKTWLCCRKNQIHPDNTILSDNGIELE